MFKNCLHKQQLIISQFAACPNESARYQKIIELGKQLPPFDEQFRTKETLVSGCQSPMYLNSIIVDQKVIFTAYSEALISAGLAAILIAVYSEEMPEVILKCPPDFLDMLGIKANLTPSRANGLYSIHLRMKQDALKFFLEKEKAR